MIIKEGLVILHEHFFYRKKHYWIEEICDTPAESLTSRDLTGACNDVA